MPDRGHRDCDDRDRESEDAVKDRNCCVRVSADDELLIDVISVRMPDLFVTQESFDQRIKSVEHKRPKQ